jgi:peptidoglycan endopeptidase LytF
LQYVSIHEGKFDAINSYDKAIFSYGFIQFTGASAVGGSLNRVMASMKAYAPAAFQRVFQRVGIDSESQSSTTVLTESGGKLRGDEAWLYIQRNVRLYGAFVQAGFEPNLIREQLRMANTLYIQTALNFKLDVILGGLRVVIPRLSDVISSEAALTAVFALAVNQGVGGMSRIVANSLGIVATQSGLNTQLLLNRINERQVVQHIAETSLDERVRSRTLGVLNSDLSFAKSV